MNSITPHQRHLLWAALAWLVLSFLLLAAFDAPSGARGGPGVLELAASARDFRKGVLSDWAQAPEVATGMPTCGIGVAYLPKIDGQIPSFGRLRCNLLVDSIGLVPAYVGLLLFFTLAFGASAPWLRQVLCVPAVAAGLFDIAENSMFAGALDDLLQSTLADATVADVACASRTKWLLLGLALAVLAYRVAKASAQHKPWNALAATASGVGAVSLAIGGALACQSANFIGMIAAGVGLLVLVWRALSSKTEPPKATSSAGAAEPAAGAG